MTHYQSQAYWALRLSPEFRREEIALRAHNNTYVRSLKARIAFALEAQARGSQTESIPQLEAEIRTALAQRNGAVTAIRAAARRVMINEQRFNRRCRAHQS